jgi:CDGSH iron-sulfur domain-containing protein 3
MKLIIRENGSILVETTGQLTVRRGETEEVLEKAKFSLCRCGHSLNKPFCDGAHKAAGFEAPGLELEFSPQ